MNKKLLKLLREYLISHDLNMDDTIEYVFDFATELKKDAKV